MHMANLEPDHFLRVALIDWRGAYNLQSISATPRKWSGSANQHFITGVQTSSPSSQYMYKNVPKL